MAAVNLDINGRKVLLPTGLFIDGEFRKARAGTTFPSENPATAEEIVQIQEGQAEHVDDAVCHPSSILTISLSLMRQCTTQVSAARKVFRSKEFSAFGPADRAKCLNKLADVMEENFEHLLAIEMLDTGKTRTQAANLDLPGSIGTLRYFAGWCDKIYGQSNFGIQSVFAYIKREPVGVCGQIIPWNFPMLDGRVEEHSGFCLWKHCRDQVRGDDAVERAQDVRVDR